MLRLQRLIAEPEGPLLIHSHLTVSFPAPDNRGMAQRAARPARALLSRQAPVATGVFRRRSQRIRTARGCVCDRKGRVPRSWLRADAHEAPHKTPCRISTMHTGDGSSAIPSPAVAACMTAPALLARNLPDTATSIDPDALQSPRGAAGVPCHD